MSHGCLPNVLHAVTQTLEDDDDYYLWDEGGHPCVPAPGARLDDAVQDVLCVPEWQEEGIPTKSKEGNQPYPAIIMPWPTPPCPLLPCPNLPCLTLPCPTWLVEDTCI